MDLADHVILVTGAGQGIGKATAIAAARLGAAVAVIDINRQTAETVCEAILAEGGRAVACSGDMSDSATISKVFDEAETALGDATGLVCAGMRRHYAPAEAMTDEKWDMVIGDGLTGYFRCARAAGQRMLPRRRGAIVFVTSIAGRSAIVGGVAYASAKSGAAGLARQLGGEWADRGVRVNAVAPGMTITEGVHRTLSSEEAAKLIPMGRTAQPSEIAATCIFLLSDQASFITGQELAVDGGTAHSRIFGGKMAGAI